MNEDKLLDDQLLLLTLISTNMLLSEEIDSEETKELVDSSKDQTKEEVHPVALKSHLDSSWLIPYIRAKLVEKTEEDNTSESEVDTDEEEDTVKNTLPATSEVSESTKQRESRYWDGEKWVVDPNPGSHYDKFAFASKEKVDEKCAHCGKENSRSFKTIRHDKNTDKITVLRFCADKCFENGSIKQQN